MNKKNIFYAALLLMAIGAEAKEIKGKVMADGKGLAKVVVTDGTAFALTSEDGSYMIDADEKAHFIYVVTPRSPVKMASKSCWVVPVSAK